MTCIDEPDMRRLRRGMARPNVDDQVAGLFPSHDQLVMVARALNRTLEVQGGHGGRESVEAVSETSIGSRSRSHHRRHKRTTQPSSRVCVYVVFTRERLKSANNMFLLV